MQAPNGTSSHPRTHSRRLADIGRGDRVQGVGSHRDLIISRVLFAHTHTLDSPVLRLQLQGGENRSGTRWGQRTLELTATHMVPVLLAGEEGRSQDSVAIRVLLNLEL